MPLTLLVMTVAVLFLTFQTADVARDMRATGLAPALAPVYGLFGGSVWAFVVLMRLMTAGPEVALWQRRLGQLPITLPRVEALSHLPVALPLAVVSGAAAVPLIAFVLESGLSPSQLLVPAAAGVSVTSWSLALSALAAHLVGSATRRPSVTSPVVSTTLALVLSVVAFTWSLMPVLSSDGAPEVGGPAWSNPLAHVLDHTGPWSALSILAVAMLAVVPLVPLVALSRSAGAGGHLVRRASLVRARSTSSAPTAGPAPGTTSALPRGTSPARTFLLLAARQRAVVSDLLACSLVAALIAWVTTVLAEQSRSSDTALFLLWTAGFPALGMIALRAALGRTQHLIGLGMRPRDLVSGLLGLTAAAWATVVAAPFAVLAVGGVDLDLVGRFLLLSVIAAALVTALGQVLRATAMDAVGRTVGTGAGLLLLIAASMLGVHRLPVLGLLVLALGAAGVWAALTALTTRRSTLD